MKKKIAFGLEQQGHVDTIEATLKRLGPGMEYSKSAWQLIGEEIGWDPFSAALAYFKHLSNNARIKSLESNIKGLQRRFDETMAVPINENNIDQHKHTPGPWSSSPQRGTPGHCFAAQVWGPDDTSLVRVEPTEDEAEASANARLIAAAPEMYEVLEDLIDHVSLPDRLHDRIESLLSKIKNDSDATD